MRTILKGCQALISDIWPNNKNKKKCINIISETFLLLSNMHKKIYRVHISFISLRFI